MQVCRRDTGRPGQLTRAKVLRPSLKFLLDCGPLFTTETATWIHSRLAGARLGHARSGVSAQVELVL